MHDFLFSVVSIFFVLGILVFVHEFGHFAVAKLFKVRVDVFSLGFGKRLMGFKRGETDYRISAIPLGGYVKMAGENPMEDHTGSPEEFSSHPRWQRFLIAIAGPAMNIILAIVVLTGLYMLHHQRQLYPTSAPVIGYVAKDSQADKAGLQIGDKILKIGNESFSNWQGVIDQLALDSGQTVQITVERAGAPLQISIAMPELDQDTIPSEAIGLLPYEPLVVAMVAPGSPAQKTGLQVGDEIIGVDNTSPHSMRAVVIHLQDVKDHPIQMTVRRGSETKTFTITPALESDGIYRVGFSAPWIVNEKLPFSEAFAQSLQTNKQTSLMIVKFLGRIVQRPKSSFGQMSSVVMMAKYSGQAAQDGWTSLLDYMALISINLGIFNLLPIPILDGGVILLLLIEGLMRRDLNRQLKERIYAAAFVFLIAFAVLVVFKDIIHLWTVHPHKT